MRKVLLWVLKANGDTLFRCSVKVDNKLSSMMERLIWIVLSTWASVALAFYSVRNVMIDLWVNQYWYHYIMKVKQICEVQKLQKLIIAPVAGLLTEPEIIIVPERSFYRVPFAALRDQPGGKSLPETFRIRIVPSLTTLKLTQGCPEDHHSQTGALKLWVILRWARCVTREKTSTVTDLPGARKEAVRLILIRVWRINWG